MSNKEQEFEDFTIINVNPDDEAAPLPELPRPQRVCSVFKVSKGFVAVTTEVVEGGAIGYGVYLIADNVEKWAGLWGYGIVGLGGVVTGTVELYKQTPTAQKKGAHYYHLFLESFVGGLVIGHYFSDLAPTQLAAFGVDLSVALAATTLSFTARMFDHHQRLPIYLKVPAYLVFGGALGFGIGDLLLENIEGFGVIVPEWAHWLTLSILGLLNMGAQLGTQSAAKFMRSGFHGFEVALFFAILMFDMLEDIRNSDDFSNTSFALIYSGATLLCVLSTLIHHNDELRHHTAHQPDDSNHNLPHDAANETLLPSSSVEILEEDEEVEKKPRSSELAKSLTKVLNQEHASTQDDQPQDEIAPLPAPYSN